MESTVIHGWTIIAHPLFLEQLNSLVVLVEALRQKDPGGYTKKKDTKLLAVIENLVFDIIPQDPTRKEYRQGDTLGDDYKHWFRVKFCQQYRLFFRYHLDTKIIVYAWVNDNGSKRAYGSKSDAYAVFKKMLKSGNPPDDMNKLIEESESFNSDILGDDNV